MDALGNDATMPLIIAGSPMPGRLAPHAILLDVAATLLYALASRFQRRTRAGRFVKHSFARRRCRRRDNARMARTVQRDRFGSIAVPVVRR
jgi:hypothetical protein